ncbi:MAG TPA: DUF559 domain-containing protein, partial [Chitinophagaceae bacterium]|nr:DUF559 domain-containing protein [Chitinophagaceae bacterium]
ARVPKYGVHTPKQYELAKEMRKGHTEAEGILWELLRDSKLGVKFRRQHPIESYIVDFVCLQEKMIVEVDGGYHNTEEQKRYDEERTKVLNEIGFDVIRFTNEEVIEHPYQVKEKIKSELGRRIPSPLVERGQGVRETNTMPGYAGSSWYFLRYMDPHNDKTFCDRKISDYWNQVDIYIGGTEHAVGHLLYSRMWTKVLFDLGLIGFDEPYKRLVNQGMIQGVSALVNFIGFNFGVNLMVNTTEEQKIRIQELKEKYKVFKDVYISDDLMIYIRKAYNNPTSEEEIQHMDFRNRLYNYFLKPISEDIENWGLKNIVQIGLLNNYYKTYVPIEYVNYKDGLDIEKIKKDFARLSNAEFITNDNKFICSREVEKMSKSKVNTVNPDEIINTYGADTFRMYEMFLGPVEMSKPWDTKGIEGVHRFLKKFWRLFFRETKTPPSEVPDPAKQAGEGKERSSGEAFIVTDEEPTAEELKVLHHAIKKIESDTERFSFNTAVSAFMIATNELTDLKCHKRKILEPLLILLSPYAPHIAEELYNQLNSSEVSPLRGDLEGASILDASFPTFEEKYVKEYSKAYPIAINGKTRTELTIALDATQQQVEEIVLADETVKKWLEGKTPKKVIYVKNKMVNLVV